MTVDSISSEKYGDCKDGPVQGNKIPRDEPIPVGQCYSIDLPSNLYYDRQDKSNIELFLRSKDGKEIPRDSWLQLENGKSRLCGLLPYQKYLINRGSFPNNVYQYQLGATDSCGNEIRNRTQSIINP